MELGLFDAFVFISLNQIHLKCMEITHKIPNRYELNHIISLLLFIQERILRKNGGIVT